MLLLGFGELLSVWAILVRVPFVPLPIYWLLWTIRARTFHPLARVPVPQWPSISRTWLMHLSLSPRSLRLCSVSVQFLNDFLQLLARPCSEYGPLVRIAPDEVSSSDPKVIPKNCPTQKSLEKTDWYLTDRPVALGGVHAFTDDNEKHHAATRKIVGPAYTLTSMLKNQRSLDEVTSLFMKKLGGFSDGNTAGSKSQISMNAMVVQDNKEVFGEEAHKFRPERWLESEEKYRATDRAMPVFGAGTRTRIGKHESGETSVSQTFILSDT
ncbi:heme binding [Ascochyta rabiei]|uniref:Heme binding n=1 Tax=Didymella rabiei TaxID=5454 RepID=A0A163KUI5_DIDRA|nr:heme binding [Ascochyta rabiei]